MTGIAFWYIVVGTMGKYMTNKYMTRKISAKENKMVFEVILVLFIIIIEMKEEQEM